MRDRKPAWWQLYLLVPIMFVLVVLEQLRPLPGISQQAVAAVITLATFGSMLLWVQVNGGMLENRQEQPMPEEQEQVVAEPWTSHSRRRNRRAAKPEKAQTTAVAIRRPNAHPPERSGIGRR